VERAGIPEPIENSNFATLLPDFTNTLLFQRPFCELGKYHAFFGFGFSQALTEFFVAGISFDFFLKQFNLEADDFNNF